MNVRDLRTKNTVNISYNISRMENNRRMEYSNEDNNTDKPTAIKKILIYLRTKRWPRCTETVHLHRTAIFMQLQRSPAILKNSPSDSTCAHVVPIRENYKETLTVERKPMILTKDFSAHS